MNKQKKSLNRKSLLVLLVLLTAVVFLASGCQSTNAPAATATQVPAAEGQQPVPQELATVPPGKDGVQEPGAQDQSAQTELPIVREEELGEGDTSFSFEVVFKDGTSHFYKINTNEKTVGSALVSLGLVEGTHGDYGLYVNTVDGVTLDFDKDKAYWAFYDQGNYANSSIDQTNIVGDALYQLKAEE